MSNSLRIFYIVLLIRSSSHVNDNPFKIVLEFLGCYKYIFGKKSNVLMLIKLYTQILILLIVHVFYVSRVIYAGTDQLTIKNDYEIIILF